MQGIGASPGQAEGQIKVVRDWQNLPQINQDTILAVPYTDAGWAPLLAQAGGLISEVGGRLSHGAIVAREYGIPAVMNLANATQRLQDGQRVRIHGESGRVELLDQESPTNNRTNDQPV
jgi:pyruvate,water dikinase